MPANKKLWAFSLLTAVMFFSLAQAEAPFPEKFGIGAVLVQSPDHPVVIRECIRGGPADQAGLLPGDTLVALDDKPASSWELKEVLAYLLLERPAPVQVTIHRGDSRLSALVFRARMSDIAKGVGFRYEPNADSTSYVAVPINEVAPVAIGDVVRPFTVWAREGCSRTTVDASKIETTVLYFWASWCAPCKLTARQIAALQLDTLTTRLVGMNVDNTCETFQSAAESLHPRGEQCWTGGWYSDAAEIFQVHRRGIPTVVVVKNARLMATATGVTAISELLRGLDK